MGAISTVVHNHEFVPRLTEIEEEMVIQLDQGKEADAGIKDRSQVFGVFCPTCRPKIIRAEIIQVICSAAPQVMDGFPPMLRIRGYKISGNLDLSKLHVPFQLKLKDCEFSSGIDISEATIAALDLAGSRATGLAGNRTTILGDIRLSEGFTSNRQISLKGAVIKGDLDCISAQLDYKDEAGAVHPLTGCDECRKAALSCYCLVLQHARIEGSVQLCGGFTAKGGVTLEGAVIGGDLNCTKALLQARSPNKLEDTTNNGRRLCCDGDSEWHLTCSLNCDGIKVDGNLILNRVKCEGVLRLTGAVVAGDIESVEGTFSPYGPEAIYADRLEVGGNIFFSDGFTATGTVRLPKAKIGTDVSFWNGRIDNQDHQFAVLYCKGIRVAGTVYLKELHAKGEVDLRSGQILGNLICTGSTFINPDGISLNADAINVSGYVKLDEGMHAEGVVSFDDAKVGSYFDCTKSSIKGPSPISLSKHKEMAFSGGKLHVGGSLYFEEFTAEGEVMLNDAQIGRNLVCTDAKVINKHGYSLRGTQMKIYGSAKMSGLQSQGHLRMDNALIEGNFAFEKGECSSCKTHLKIQDHCDKELGENYALHAYGARVMGDFLFGDGFEATGLISLRSITIGGVFRWGGLKNTDAAVLDLRFAKAQTLEDDPKSWPKKILLNGFEYSALGSKFVHLQQRLTERWLKSDSFNPQPYEQLALVLKQQGYEKQAEEVLIEKNKMLLRLPVREGYLLRIMNRHAPADEDNPQGTEKKQSLGSKISMFILRHLVVFGYRPFRALLWSLLFVLLGWGVFAAGFRWQLIQTAKEGGYGVKTEAAGPGGPSAISAMYASIASSDYRWAAGAPTDTQKVGTTAPPDKQKGLWFDGDLVLLPLFYSLDTFLPIDLQMGDYILPMVASDSKGKEMFSKFLVGYRFFHIVLGWLCTGLFVAALTGLVRK